MYDRFLPAGKLQSREAREKARPRVVPPLAILPAQEPIQEALLVPEAMAKKTLREFSVPSTDNVANGPNINVGDMNFELKSNLINMV